MNLRTALVIGALTFTAVPATAAPFGQYYGFGDSLTDTGRVFRETGYDAPGLIGQQFFNAPGIYEGGRWSNAPNFFEVVPSLIGVPTAPQNSFAVGGAQSIRQAPDPLLSPTFDWGLPDQIDTFAARVGQFAPNDLINVWIGYNDLSQIPTTATPAEQSAAIAEIVSNTADAITSLAGLGGREFVVFNQQTFRPDGRGALASELNVELGAALQPLSASGLAIRYFDVDAVLNEVRANPTVFGFLPNAETAACSADPVCAQNGAATGLEDQYISPEGIHLTGRANTIVAQALADELNAAVAVPEPASLTLLALALAGAVGASRVRQRHT